MQMPSGEASNTWVVRYWARLRSVMSVSATGTLSRRAGGGGKVVVIRTVSFSPLRVRRSLSASKDVRPSAIAISAPSKTFRVSGTYTLSSDTRSSSLLSAANNSRVTSLTSTIFTIEIAAHPEFVDQAISMVKIVDVNELRVGGDVLAKILDAGCLQLVDRRLELREIFLPDGHADHLEDVSVSPLAFEQLLFGALAFGHVHSRTDELNELARRVEDWMAHRVDVPEGPARKNGSETPFASRSFPDRSLEVFARPGSIVGVNALDECVQRGNAACGIEAEQAKQFLGCVDQLLAGDVQRPAARIRQPLRFSEIGLAPAQGLFGALALGDVVVGLQHPGRPPLLVALQGPAARHHHLRAVAFRMDELSFPLTGPVELGFDLREWCGEGGLRELMGDPSDRLR